MPGTKTTKQHETTKRQPNSFRKPQGTRIGTLEDWREGSTKSVEITGRHGQSIRDGR